MQNKVQKFSFEMIVLTISIIFCIMCTIAYVQLPIHLKDIYLSNLFLMYFICLWIITLESLFRMIKKYWKIDSIILIRMITIYPVYKFIMEFSPFSNGCNVYNTDDTHLMCTCIRIIIYFAIVSTCFTSVAIAVSLFEMLHVYILKYFENNKL